MSLARLINYLLSFPLQLLLEQGPPGSVSSRGSDAYPPERGLDADRAAQRRREEAGRSGHKGRHQRQTAQKKLTLEFVINQTDEDLAMNKLAKSSLLTHG